jgi:hypothetical protein
MPLPRSARRRPLRTTKKEASVGSLHHLEAGEIDLAAFNYSEMDNLKIESDNDTVKSTKDKSEISV